MLWWKHQQLRMGSPKTRFAVVETLAESYDENAVSPLIFALEDKEADVRCAAAKALVRYRDRRAVEPLIGVLQDTAPLARAAAAETLGRLGDPLAVGPLAQCLRDEDPIVRGIAARSLNRLEWRPGTEAQRLLHILALGNLHELANMGPEGVGHLLEVVRNGTPNKQLTAVKTLAGLVDPRIRPAMLAALKNSTPAVRIAALGALGPLADPTTFSEVEPLLQDGNASVRCVAVEVAAKCGGGRAVPALLKCLKDTSWEVRKETADALGMLGDPSAVPGLCGLVQDADRDVRERAIVALGCLGQRAGLLPLVPALLDPESVLRNAAAAALRKIDPGWADAEVVFEAVPKIKAALRHPEYWVRHCASQLLEQLKIETDDLRPPPPGAAKLALKSGPHPAFPVLADLLFDPDRDLRLAAAVSLGRLREQSAAGLLTNAVRDSDFSVRQAVLSALTALN